LTVGSQDMVDTWPRKHRDSCATVVGYRVAGCSNDLGGMFTGAPIVQGSVPRGLGYTWGTNGADHHHLTTAKDEHGSHWSDTVSGE